MTQFLFTEQFLLGTGMNESEVYDLFCSPLQCSMSAQVTGIRSIIMDKAHPTPLGSSHPFFAAHTKILSAPEVCEESTLVRLKEEHWEVSSQAFDPLSCLLLLSGTATAVCQRCFSSWSSSRCSKSSHHLRALQEAQITEKEGFKVS